MKIYSWDGVLVGQYLSLTESVISLLCRNDNIGEVYTVSDSHLDHRIVFIGTMMRITKNILIYTSIDGFVELFERIADGPNGEFRFKQHRTDIRRP